MLEYATFTLPDPIGPVFLVWHQEGLVALDFGEADGRLRRLLQSRFGPAVQWEAASAPHPYVLATKAYFDGDFTALDTLPADGGGTLFQRRVWTALRAIPSGQTRSYAEIAIGIGQPTATRAVGMANGRNPISLVVPCHRVIGTSGALTGYGGGLERKRWLLAHERVVPAKE